MHLGDIKIAMSLISLDNLMLQLKLIVLGSSYVSHVVIAAPPQVAASISIVCGRCTAHLMGVVRIVNRRANVPLQNAICHNLR